MRKNLTLFFYTLFSTTLFLGSCSSPDSSSKFTDKKINTETVPDNPYLEQYPNIPDAAKMFNAGPDGEPLIAELRVQYEEYIKKVKNAIEATGSKFVLVNMSPDAGTEASQYSKAQIPFIRSVAQRVGADFIDLTPIVAKYAPTVITQYPRDGHWSKKGAEVMADAIGSRLANYESVRNTKTYTDEDRSATFGDLEPNDDEILDGGKDLPYHLVVNNQGLRNGFDVTFPKTKQRFLFLGDSEIYCPFLDNEFIISELLNKKFPNKEFLNAGRIGYTVDDCLSQFEEKGKFAEADVVFVFTNSEDIADLYFSNRNKFSRTHRVVEPSKVEKTFYANFMQKK